MMAFIAFVDALCRVVAPTGCAPVGPCYWGLALELGFEREKRAALAKPCQFVVRGLPQRVMFSGVKSNFREAFRLQQRRK